MWFEVSYTKKMRKEIAKNPGKLQGKTKGEILLLLGNNYYSEYGGGMWVYAINKTWFSRREEAIVIDFDLNEVVEKAQKINIDFSDI